MRNFITLLSVISAVLLASAVATAQDKAGDDEPNRSERRQRMIQAFDADGDGQLNEAERAKAREELGGQSDQDDRPRGDRQGRGPRPEGPPDLGLLFDRFDENKDDQLSRDEFMKLTAALREMRERRGSGSPDGRGRANRDDRPGPPPGDEDRPQRRRRDLSDVGEDFRPLQNPGPPPREEERGYRGREDDRGERGRRGDGRGDGHGPDRMGPPNPERLFNAFDANDDGQLSRKEFAKLTATMREGMAGMRERGDRPGPPEDGGRGRFRGPERPEGPPGPPRPPRPEFENADPPAPSADDNAA